VAFGPCGLSDTRSDSGKRLAQPLRFAPEVDMTHKLFESYQLNSLSLKKRRVMVTMTRCRAGAEDTPAYET
jgi:hypothetical protein